MPYYFIRNSNKLNMNSVTIKEYEFNEKYFLKLDNNIHRSIPEFIVIHLHPSHLGGPQLHDNASEELINRLIYRPLLNKMKFVSFQILINEQSPINEQLIQNIPFSFLFSYKKPIKRENKLYISLHVIKNLISYLDTYTLSDTNYNYIMCKINNWEELVNHVEKYNLITKNYMYDPKLLPLDATHLKIQQMRSFYLTCDARTRFIFHLYDFIGTYSGFFIECDNINELLEIDFYYSIDLQIIYNSFLIEQYTKKISEQMLYFSFNPDNFISYVNMNINNKYRYNFDRMNQSIITLSFSEPQKKVGIHGFTYNKFTSDSINTLEYVYDDAISILQNNSLI